ncbi:MAG: type II secretion system protein [Candidatus Cloacimonetes bacterium]|nr:type II secretion system protein [Candidatus Cloacimonadota bacterium]
MFKAKKNSNKAFSLVEVLIAVGMIAALFGAFFLILSQARNMTISLREKQRMSWVLKYEASQIQEYYIKNEELPKFDESYINRLVARHKFPKFITKFRLLLSDFKTGDFNDAFVLTANWKQKGKSFEQKLKFNYTEKKAYKLLSKGDL